MQLDPVSVIPSIELIAYSFESPSQRNPVTWAVNQ